MKSKILLQAAALLVAVSLFAGCGGGEAPTTTATPTSTPAASVITVDELKAKLDAGANIAIVDTRSTRSYDKAHIAEAISIPLADLEDEDDNALTPEELDQRYGYLRSYEEIITYCT